MPTVLSLRVPAKIILSGEYAILRRGSSCLVSTLQRYLHLRVVCGPRRGALPVSSNLWEQTRYCDATTPRGEMLLDTIAELQLSAPEYNIAALKVVSDLDPVDGFGSSSALRLALVGAAHLTKTGTTRLDERSRWQLAERAFRLQQQRQGLASGVDVIAQLCGGIVRCGNDGEAWPGTVHRYAPPTHARLAQFVHLFTGVRGAATTHVLHTTQRWLRAGGREQHLLAVSAALDRAFAAILDDGSRNNLHALIAATAAWRKFFADAPGFPQQLRATLQNLAGCDQHWSYKTCGAGGNDAFIVIGRRADITDVITCLAAHQRQQLVLPVATQGLTVTQELC